MSFLRGSVAGNPWGRCMSALWRTCGWRYGVLPVRILCIPDRIKPAFAQEPGKTGTGLRRANFSQQETGKNLVDTVAKNSNRVGGAVLIRPVRPRRTAVLP